MTTPEDRQATGYDPLYAAFDSPLMQQVRREAYGEDIGQHSWVTPDELRSDIARVALTASSRLLDLGCGPGGPLVFAVRSTGCRGTGVDASVTALPRGAPGLARPAFKDVSISSRRISTYTFLSLIGPSTPSYPWM
jgi:SAM-dependent methyltransferase